MAGILSNIGETGVTDVTYRKRDEIFDVVFNAATCWGLCNAIRIDGTEKRGTRTIHTKSERSLKCHCSGQ